MNVKTKALIAVIVGNAIFGFSFLFSKIALELTIPSVMLAVRFTVAFLALNLVVLIGKMTKKFDFSLTAHLFGATIKKSFGGNDNAAICFLQYGSLVRPLLVPGRAYIVMPLIRYR